MAGSGGGGGVESVQGVRVGGFEERKFLVKQFMGFVLL